MASIKTPSIQHRTKTGNLTAAWSALSFAGEKCPKCRMYKSPKRALCRFDMEQIPLQLYTVLVTAPPRSYEYRRALLTAMRRRKQSL